MLKKTPDKTVELTEDQTNTLATYYTKLSNIQSEIANNVNVLTGTKSECERALTEKTYLEDQIVALKEDIEVLEVRKTELGVAIEAGTTVLSETTEKTTALNNESYAKVADIIERENTLKKNEADYAAKVEDFTSKSSQLLADQEAIKTAKDAFQKATDTVTW